MRKALTFLLAGFLLFISIRFFIFGIKSKGSLLTFYYFFGFLLFLIFFSILSVPPFTDWIAKKFVHSLYFPDTGKVEEKLYSIPRSLAKEENFEEAVKEYRNILEKDPDDRKARMEMADILLDKLNKREEAIKEFNILHDTAEDKKEKIFFLNRIIDIWIKEGEIKKAKKTLESSLNEWEGKEKELIKERIKNLSSVK